MELSYQTIRVHAKYIWKTVILASFKNWFVEKYWLYYCKIIATHVLDKISLCQKQMCRFWNVWFLWIWFYKELSGNNVAIKLLPIKSYIQALRNESSKINLDIMQKNPQQNIHY